ncbi:MAG TPA: porin family protein [Xanthobacteraceae bacterium]|jgi:outer membrane immunogenic protein
MKKALLAAVALAAVGVVPGMAADLRTPAPVYKAPPPPAPVYSWTGCYLGGGFGYGMWNQELTSTFSEEAVTVVQPDQPGSGPFTSQTTTAGGRGWLGTLQVGCDYQLSGDWVIGAFGDWDFESLKGNPELSDTPLFGHEKQTSAWAVGARLGYLVLPQLLAFVSAGYTQAHFNSFELFYADFGESAFEHVPSHTYHGWFIGTGYEYGLKWFPGLFWKTEYRYSQFSGVDLPVLFDNTADVDFFIHSKKFEQTIRSELVWRFNWGGGVVRAPY